MTEDRGRRGGGERLRVCRFRWRRLPFVPTSSSPKVVCTYQLQQSHGPFIFKPRSSAGRMLRNVVLRERDRGHGQSLDEEFTPWSCLARHPNCVEKEHERKRWRERRRRSEPLDDTKSEGNDSFESAAQCARMHTALPLQAESTGLPLTGRGQAVSARWSTERENRRHSRRRPQVFGDTGDATLSTVLSHTSSSKGCVRDIKVLFLTTVDTLFMRIKRIDQSMDQPSPGDTSSPSPGRETGERFSPHRDEGRLHRTMP